MSFYHVLSFSKLRPDINHSSPNQDQLAVPGANGLLDLHKHLGFEPRQLPRQEQFGGVAIGADLYPASHRCGPPEGA